MITAKQLSPQRFYAEPNRYFPCKDRDSGDPCGIIRDAALWQLCRCRHNCHWSKHPTRLNRNFGRKKFGDEGYAREELVAEIGSAFLCCDLGITPEPRDDHAAYLGYWLNVLKEDKRAIFQAAAHAQRAVDYLHGLQPGGVVNQELEAGVAA
jgi:antirestriction protein ArdC